MSARAVMSVIDVLSWINIAIGTCFCAIMLRRLTVGRDSAEMREPGARSRAWLGLSSFLVSVATGVLWLTGWRPAQWLLTVVATAYVIWAIRVLRSDRDGGKSAGPAAERP